MRVSLASAAGSPDKPNEDWVGATTNVVVVLDGITTPDGLATGCEHGTVWFVHQLGAWLLGLASTEPDVPLRDHLAASIKNVADTHADTCDTTHTNTPGATVAMLRERGDQVEWLVLADAFVLLHTRDGLTIHHDNRLESVAIEERRVLQRAELGTPEHEAARQKLVAAQRRVRNTDGGYWIASSNPTAADHAQVGVLRAMTSFRAVLLTDGAAALATFGAITWPELFELVDADSPAALIQRTREAEASDPVGRQWSRFKRHDDATAVLCRSGRMNTLAVEGSGARF
jgi:hypothetical protein